MAPKKRGHMTEEEIEAARAKDKERYLQKKLGMTKEEREAVRAKDKERYLQKKLGMTEEEREAVRARDKKRHLQKKADMTEEEIEAVRAKERERYLQKKADMAEEERKALRAKERERYWQKKVGMTVEEIEAVRAKERQINLQNKADMTESEKQKLEERTKAAIRMTQKRAAKSEKQKQEERARAAKRKAERRAAKSEQQKLEERAKSAKRMAIYRAATKRAPDRSSLDSLIPVNRIKTLISCVSNRVDAKTAGKYETARTSIKNMYFEMISLHEELGQLKTQLKQTLADAVGSAVKRQIGDKCKAAELHASTFVEIPLSLAADKITTLQNVSDPLLLQTGKECHPEVLRLSVDPQDQNDKIFDPSFQVIVHDLISDEKSVGTSTITAKILRCSICSKKFGTSLGLTIHQREHNLDSNEFNCSICSEVFRTYNLMSTHYLQAHCSQFCDIESSEETDDELERSIYEIDFMSTRQCFICFKTMDLTSFRNHIIDHHGENKELLKYFIYICCRCDKPHALMRSLTSHWKMICYEKWKKEGHNNEGSVCEHCGSKLSNEKSLSIHLKIFHSEKKLVCEKCGNKYRYEENLKNHIAAVHQAQYKFECEHCAKKFKYPSTLKKHKKTVHFCVKSFACKFCSKRFATIYNLECHENTHTGEKPYECKECGKSFAAKSSLFIHAGVHKGYKCVKCGETFSSYFNLITHRKLNHSGPNTRLVYGSQDYMCEICGKVYKHPAALKNHKFSHDNIKRFGCNLCGRKFRQATNFYQHRKVAHINENAKIVNFVSKTIVRSLAVEGGISKQLSNLKCAKKLELALQQEPNSNAGQTSIETSPAENQISSEKCAKSDISDKHNSERENSSVLDDYFSDVEFDNQDNELENSVAQFEIAELRDACPDLADTVFTSHTKDSDLNKQISERSSADQFIPSTVKTCRASVPLGLSGLCDEAANTQLTKENRVESKESDNQHQVFIEDETANFLLVDVNTADLVKMKTEKLGVEVDKTSIDRIELHSDDTTDENDGEENSTKSDCDEKQKLLQFSPRLLVKLTRLLEYNCVPCGKTIFTVSQREIRIHRRTHRTKISQNEEIVIKKRKIRKRSLNKSDVEMKGSYDCVYCDEKGFVRCRELVVHCSQQHPGKKPLKCKMCPEMFTSYNTLREHKSKAHDANRKKCSSNESDIRKNYDCLYCENTRFVSCRELVDHCSNEHPGKAPLRCIRCPEKFTSAKTLREHRAKVHDATLHIIEKGKNEFECELCGKKFNLRHYANNHFLFIHQERKFKCDVCSKSFPTVKELERHQLRHLATKSHLCEECGKAFFTPHELTDHIEVVHRKIYKRKRENPVIKVHPFSCNICPCTFKQESGLKAHLELHDPKRKFSCDECGLRYKFYTNVITHKNYRHKKNEKRNIGVTTHNE